MIDRIDIPIMGSTSQNHQKVAMEAPIIVRKYNQVKSGFILRYLLNRCFGIEVSFSTWPTTSWFLCTI